jgi:hypothetical protein
MSAIYQHIRRALEVELDNQAIADVAYENISFTPTTGTSFLQPVFTPTIRRPAVMGTGPQQRYQGIFRVLCHAAEGTGPSVADGLANSVIAAFEAATDISYNTGSETIKVSISYAERSAGILDTPWYIVPVNIGWYIFD